jgi:hypothetical protein
MVDMAAIASAAGALKTAYDLSKAAIGAHDAGAIRAKVAEMQGEISSALASAITAQTDQMAILKRVSDLEKEVADLKAWEAQKQRYHLKRFDPGVFVYSLKENDPSGEPPHQICPACYENGKKQYLQATARTQGGHRVHACPGCKHEYAFGPKAFDGGFAAQHRSAFDPFAGL